MCNFQTFGCSNESSPNSSSHFWNHTTRSGFIQILHHRSVSWKISPLYFFSSNIIHFGQKQPIEVKFVGFWVFGWKFTKFLMSNLKVNRQVSFSLNFASLFNVMGDSLLYFFSWNFIWFLQKEPTTVQNFRLLTAQVKFHQIWTLIRYFCWKYVCVCLRPSTLKSSSVWDWKSRVQINDVVLKTLFFSAKFLLRYFSMNHQVFLTSLFILFAH